MNFIIGMMMGVMLLILITAIVLLARREQPELKKPKPGQIYLKGGGQLKTR